MYWWRAEDRNGGASPVRRYNTYYIRIKTDCTVHGRAGPRAGSQRFVLRSWPGTRSAGVCSYCTETVFHYRHRGAKGSKTRRFTVKNGIHDSPTELVRSMPTRRRKRHPALGETYQQGRRVGWRANIPEPPLALIKNYHHIYYKFSKWL